MRQTQRRILCSSTIAYKYRAFLWHPREGPESAVQVAAGDCESIALEYKIVRYSGENDSRPGALSLSLALSEKERKTPTQECKDNAHQITHDEIVGAVFRNSLWGIAVN